MLFACLWIKVCTRSLINKKYPNGWSKSYDFFFTFSFSMTSFGWSKSYNADASNHFSWSHPNFFFLCLLVLKLMRRDFFHFYKQVQIPTSVFIKKKKKFLHQWSKSWVVFYSRNFAGLHLLILVCFLNNLGANKV